MNNFVDLKPLRESVKVRIGQVITNALDHGLYILVPEVEFLGSRFAKFFDAKYALVVANGTYALVLDLRSLSIKAGDAVFRPSFTYCA
jgi:dTDP-4-amino-4,6-dideoxygalactose transaminase